MKHVLILVVFLGLSVLAQGTSSQESQTAYDDYATVRLWCLNMFDKDHIDAQTCASALK